MFWVVNGRSVAVALETERETVVAHATFPLDTSNNLLRQDHGQRQILVAGFSKETGDADYKGFEEY